jgi:hypothetical protein
MNAILVSPGDAYRVVSRSDGTQITGRICNDGRVAFSEDQADLIAAAGAHGDIVPWHSVELSDAPFVEAAPQVVSARQIRLWLIRHGVSLATVEAAIDGIGDAVTRESVRVEWEYAPYVERSHAWLVPMAAALGLTEQQLDAAFREAATL